MKVSRYITTILLSLALVVTSTGMTAFATDAQGTEAEDQQTMLEEEQDSADGVTEDAAAEEAAAESAAQEPSEEVTAEQAAAEEAVNEESGTDSGAMADEESDDVEAAGADIEVLAENVNPLSYSDAGISSYVKKSLKGYRSILIAGLDNGGRADLIIVFSYKGKSAKVFTVARDTYMQLNDKKVYTVHGKKRDFCKCNQAAEYGSLEVLIRELNRHLDLNIREYIGIDWETTAKLVDKLGEINGTGGIRVNITNASMLAGINQMLPANNKVKGSGWQTLNGGQTVQYLRVRHYYASNKDKKAGVEAGARVREDRNRDYFVQLYKMGKEMGYARMLDVYSTIADGLVTNMNIVDALKLVANTVKVPAKKARFPYKHKDYWDPDGFYVYNVMNSNTSNVQKLHKIVFGQKKYKLSKTAKSLNKKTQNKVKKYLKKKRPTLSKAVVKVSGTEYTGSPVTPTVTVKLGDRVLENGSDYELSGFKTDNEMGTYSFTVKGLGSAYHGQNKTVKYSVGPKGTSLTSVKKAKKSFTASWKEQPDVSGYQIQYSLKKNFSKPKNVSVGGSDSLSKTVKKLKNKKTYYVRVRTYVTDSKGTYYSAWSAAKKVKTK